MPIQMTIKDNGSTTALIKQLMAMKEETRILDKDEERAMIEKYRNDPEELQRQLVMHNIRLVFNQCKKYAFSAKSFDELVGRCLYMLCYAAKKFDPDRNIKFTTYAVPWIYKGAFEYDWNTRREVRDPMLNPTSLDQLISDVVSSSKNDGNGATMENFVNEQIDENFHRTVPSTEEQILTNEQSNVVKRLQSYIANDPSFENYDADILMRRYFEKQSYKEISTALDIPIKIVKQRESKMLSKFRDYLATEMNIGSYQDIAKNSEHFLSV